MSKPYNLSNRSVLHKIAKPLVVGEIVSHIVHAMNIVIATSERKALGLAAPQIGISKRIIILINSDMQQVLINPVITRRRLGKATSKESCLSFSPDYSKKMKRDKQVIVEGFNEYWEKVKIKARGLDSYVIQHEIDHLNGVTI